MYKILAYVERLSLFRIPSNQKAEREEGMNNNIFDFISGTIVAGLGINLTVQGIIIILRDFGVVK